MDNHSNTTKKDILEKIRDQSRYRPIVPFIGSGISISAGYPTVRLVIQYLAKVDFAIRFGVFRDRFPLINEDEKKQDALVDYYRQNPSKYLEDFGWPNIGQLDADLWSWLGLFSTSTENSEQLDKGRRTILEYEKKRKNDLANKGEVNHDYSDILTNDISPIEIDQTTNKNCLDLRDHLHAIVQWTLREELSLRDYGARQGILETWLKWKGWYHERETITKPDLLFGDWEMLLDKLCEGNHDLADRLFSELETGLQPALPNRLLAFLQPKLGIPLVLTTNFDSLLERAFRGEGLKPKIFDVHKEADLPTPELVRNQLSILKLHGSAYGLRFGERLRQRLESDARNTANRYLPENALVLVLGFSGSERRMMQLLQAFVQDQEFDSDEPRLIWIQGPSDLGPLFLRLIDNAVSNGTSKKVECYKVRHADTFLQDLYFKIANSHQSSEKNYSSLPGQLRMTELELKLDSSDESNKKIKDNRRPVQVFSSYATKSKPSGSWATLAGVAFTRELDPAYTIIWIDLEYYQTVEGVIAEFFNRIRVIDPQAPYCNINSLYIEDEDKLRDEREKVVARIREVFQRGRYVLVLDSLESFGRPAMIHHGIPTYQYGENSEKEKKIKSKKKNYLKGSFEDNLNNLYTFLDILLGFKKENGADHYWDLYIVITIEQTHSRHRKYKNVTQKNSLDKKILHYS